MAIRYLHTGALWLLYTPTRYVPAKLRILMDHLPHRLRDSGHS